ncbi:MAG: hypothetical protein ACKV2T_10480, partial [Kofleriaceae bacterium]
MLVSIHFPCADVRGFLPEAAGRLRKPHWQLPESSDFVRTFGPLRQRVAGGSKLFSGEGMVCRADGAIRFPRWTEKDL